MAIQCYWSTTKWWEAKQIRKIIAICYNAAHAQIRLFDDGFWTVQTVFPVFEGGELPSKALE